MSYCRWSSDGHNCDVYVYEDVSGGYTCHVAGLRIINLHEAPRCPNLVDMDYPRKENGEISDEALADFMTKHTVYMNWLRDKAIRKPIGLEHDGQSFNVETPGDMAATLCSLKEL
jgi:hypothetical protein